MFNKHLLQSDWDLKSHSLWLGILINILILLMVGIFLNFYIEKHYKAVATVNITGLYKSFVQETAKQNFTPEEKKQIVVQFSHALDAVIKDVSHKQHLVLVPSEAVLSGATDITDEIQQQLKEKMKL